MSGITLDGLSARLAPDVRLDGDGTTVVTDACHDSTAVTDGALFCCVPGSHADGHDHAPVAVAAGARALLVERPLGLGVPELVVPSTRAVLGPVAAAVHGDPSAHLTCVGVTGTNGKTSTVAILASILEADGRSVQVIGTLTGVRTTPEATDLQRLLAHARSDGATTVIMEVSSHALAQGRVTATHFDLAVFTNLSPDHLDYHHTMSDYFRAKALLFDPDLSARAVVNLDDSHGRLLADAALIPTVGFSTADAEPVTSIAPLAFHLEGEPVTMPLSGRFNLENALAAATAAAQLGVDGTTIRAGLAATAPVPGRLEPIVAGQPFSVFVDFAHTPDGLRRVLATARELAGEARVVVVFGAGGDRDHAKRPLMGTAAEAGADVVVVTSDNPRNEAPDAIAAAVVGGLHAPEAAVLELDRRRAIGVALDAANRGDVVVIAGKGHEQLQVMGDEARPFDDRVVARELLAERGWRS